MLFNGHTQCLMIFCPLTFDIQSLYIIPIMCLKQLICLSTSVHHHHLKSPLQNIFPFTTHQKDSRFLQLPCIIHFHALCPPSHWLVNLSLIFQESQLSLIFFINTLFSMAKVFRFLRHNAIYESVKFDVQILSYSVYTVY